MEKELITAVALGIGLSASAGLRVFIPLLISGIASRLGFLELNDSFMWLAGNTALLTLGVATLAEILAYYIPVVDNFLDTITTPLSIGAGTLLLASVLPVDNELVRWVLGFFVGGGAAGAVQGGMAVLRLGSTGTTGGIGNFVVSSGENIASVMTSVFTLILPVVMALIIIISFFFIFRLLFRRKRMKRSPN